MDLDSLSIGSISAWKQSQIQSEAAVLIQKKANEQTESAALTLIQTIRTPEPGKGQKLNVAA